MGKFPKNYETNKSDDCSHVVSHGWYDCQIGTLYKFPFKSEALSVFTTEEKYAQTKLSFREYEKS